MGRAWVTMMNEEGTEWVMPGWVTMMNEVGTEWVMPGLQ